MIYLVRHAKAGSRTDFVGDDRLRPLTSKGARQADQLADRLAPLTSPDSVLVSSPYLRCVQTLEPLADLLATRVRIDERLAEDMGFTGAIVLASTLPDGSVLCSHGDVIPETVAALERRGCDIVGEPEWGKASVWVLTRSDGHVVSATAWAPPED